MKIDFKKDAAKVSQLALELTQGYYTYVVMLAIAQDERSDSLLAEYEQREVHSGPFIKNSKTGDSHSFIFEEYYRQARNNSFVKDYLERVWFLGALLSLGDELAKHIYFDRDPVLELIRHLRNGIAHGNKFRIDDPSKLIKYPAHNKFAYPKSTADYEITPALNDQTVLFDFIEPCDLAMLFNSVGLHLARLAQE